MKESIGRGDRVIETTNRSGDIYIVDAITAIGRLKLVNPDEYNAKRMSIGGGHWVMSDKVRKLPNETIKDV